MGVPAKRDGDCDCTCEGCDKGNHCGMVGPCGDCGLAGERADGVVLSTYHIELPEGQWAVRVLGGGEYGADWKTVFASGVQSFTIVEYAFAGGEEARIACEWFATQFRTAMKNLGAPPETLP